MCLHKQWLNETDDEKALLPLPDTAFSADFTIVSGIVFTGGITLY